MPPIVAKHLLTLPSIDLREGRVHVGTDRDRSPSVWIVRCAAANDSEYRLYSFEAGRITQLPLPPVPTEWAKLARLPDDGFVVVADDPEHFFLEGRIYGAGTGERGHFARPGRPHDLQASDSGAIWMLAKSPADRSYFSVYNDKGNRIFDWKDVPSNDVERAYFECFGFNVCASGVAYASCVFVKELVLLRVEEYAITARIAIPPIADEHSFAVQGDHVLYPLRRIYPIGKDGRPRYSGAPKRADSLVLHDMDTDSHESCAVVREDGSSLTYDIGKSFARGPRLFLRDGLELYACELR